MSHQTTIPTPLHTQAEVYMGEEKNNQQAKSIIRTKEMSHNIDACAPKVLTGDFCT